ncbi:hypothetical protein LY76DRAFT_110680, partial [Colletotrichum caudatum]
DSLAKFAAARIFSHPLNHTTLPYTPLLLASWFSWRRPFLSPRALLPHESSPMQVICVLLTDPPVPTSLTIQGKAARIRPNTDFGLITPLFQDGAGGLKIENRAKHQNHPNLQTNGKNDDEPDFLPVEPEPGNIMVREVSDTLERWTNGELPAGARRVILPLAFNQDVDNSGEAEILPGRYSTAVSFKAAGEERM